MCMVFGVYMNIEWGGANTFNKKHGPVLQLDLRNSSEYTDRLVCGEKSGILQVFADMP